MFKITHIFPPLFFTVVLALPSRVPANDYFAIVVGGTEFHIKKEQLAPLKRGQETADIIDAYSPDNPEQILPLDKVEEAVGEGVTEAELASIMEAYHTAVRKRARKLAEYPEKAHPYPPLPQCTLRLSETGNNKALDYLLTYGASDTKDALHQHYPTFIASMSDMFEPLHDSEVSFEADERCPICNESLITEHELIKIQCDHLYHPSCLGKLYKAFDKIISCVLCNQPARLPLDIIIEDQFIQFAGEGNIHWLRLLLKWGVDINQADADGNTALHLACFHQHKEAINVLLEYGVDTNIQNNAGLRPIELVHESEKESLIMLEAFIESQLSLFESVAQGKRKKLADFLAEGGNPNLQDEDNNQTSLLGIAARHGHEKLAGMLLQHRDLNLNKADAAGNTSLMVAVRNGHLEVVKLLLYYGAEFDVTNDDGDTPLILATRNNHTNVVRLLLGQGAEVNKTDAEGLSPLHITLLNGHPEIATILQDRGAEVVKNTDENGFTLLHHAAKNGHTAIATLLLDQGEQINASDIFGHTPLHYADEYGHTETAKLLLDRGALVENGASVHQSLLADLDRGLTISLIGQMNAGKSSLGNCLVGFRHFETKIIRNKEDEGDFTFHGLRIRSLPGYGDLVALPAGKFLERYPIAKDELVLMVMADVLDELDEIVLEGLIEQGHPPEQIIFVRNKFQSALSPELKKREIKPETAQAAEIENALKKKLQDSHRKILKDLDKELDKKGLALKIPHVEDHHDLLFTTAMNVCDFQDGDALVRKIRSRLTKLGQRRGFDLFICLRPNKHQTLLCALERSLRQCFSSQNPIHFQTIANQLNSLSGLADVIPGDWLGELNNQYECDYERKIHTAREGLNTQRDKLTERLTVATVSARADDDEPDQAVSQAEAFREFYRLLWPENSAPLPADQAWDSLTATEKQRYLAFAGNLDATIKIWAKRFSTFYTVHKLGRHWYRKLGGCLDAVSATPEADVYHDWADHALHLAVTGPTDNPDAVRMLITRFGADPHKKSQSGKDYFEPVHWAAASGHECVIRMLTAEFGVGIDTVSRKGYTPLHIAARQGHAGLVTKLITECNANPDARACNGYTLLHVAAAEDHTELAWTLIRLFSAHIHAKDKDKNMPLHIAAKGGHTDFARMLIDDFEVSPCVTNHYNDTPLHHAARNGRTEFVRMLLTEDRARSDARNCRGNTPLHETALGGNAEIARMLISKDNANPYARNRRDQTPIDLALMRGGYGHFLNHMQVLTGRRAATRRGADDGIIQLFEQLLRSQPVLDGL